MKRFSVWLSVLASACLIVLGLPAAATSNVVPGALDTSFGNGGIASITSSGLSYPTAWTSVLQPDGKLVVGGAATDPLGNTVFLVSRLNTDGRLDSSFGTGGTVTAAYSLGVVLALALQPDGKIVAATESGFIVRLHPDGSFDHAFGPWGTVTVSSPINALALQPDGKIVAAGSDFVARLNPDGSFDSSFASSGVQSTPAGVAAVALQPDGKIVAAGGSHYTSFGSAFFVVRLDAGGSLDTTFGSGGVVMRQLGAGPYSWAAGVLVQPDGKIVAGGGCIDSNGYDQVAVARLDSKGDFDSSFGSAGVVLAQPSPPPHGSSYVRALALQPNGKIVAAGHASDGFEDTSLVMRLEANGSLDTSFAAGGLATSHWGRGFSFTTLALEPDGKVIAAGWGVLYLGNFALAARLIVDVPPTASFGGSPLPATAGQTVSFDGSGSNDTDGSITGYAWGFGDGATAIGSNPRHVYAKAGTYTVTLTVTDDYGLTNTAAAAVTVRPPIPVLSRLQLRPHSFRAARHGGSIARHGVTTVTYYASLAGKTRFTIHRVLAGRVKGAVRGSFVHRDRAGANSFHFTGRLGNQRLRPGSYRLDATSTASGRTGATIHIRFQIIR